MIKLYSKINCGLGPAIGVLFMSSRCSGYDSGYG